MFTGTDPTKLGGYAKDKITGFEGFVCAKFYYISGCACAWLQSTKLKDGKPIGQNVNTKRLTELSTPKPYTKVTAPETCDIDMGEKVRVPHLGIEGTVTTIAFYPEDATHIEITPAYNTKEGKPAETVSVAQALVESIGRKIKRVEDKRTSPPSAPKSWD